MYYKYYGCTANPLKTFCLLYSLCLLSTVCLIFCNNVSILIFNIPDANLQLFSK